MHARARKAGRKDKSYKTKKRSIRNETEESIDYSEDEEEQAKQKDRRRGREKPFLPSTDALRISRFPDIGKRQRGPETAPEPRLDIVVVRRSSSRSRTSDDGNIVLARTTSKKGARANVQQADTSTLGNQDTYSKKRGKPLERTESKTETKPKALLKSPVYIQDPELPQNSRKRTWVEENIDPDLLRMTSYGNKVFLPEKGKPITRVRSKATATQQLETADAIASEDENRGRPGKKPRMTPDIGNTKGSRNGRSSSIAGGMSNPIIVSDTATAPPIQEEGDLKPLAHQAPTQGPSEPSERPVRSVEIPKPTGTPIKTTKTTPAQPQLQGISKQPDHTHEAFVQTDRTKSASPRRSILYIRNRSGSMSNLAISKPNGENNPCILIQILDDVDPKRLARKFGEGSGQHSFNFKWNGKEEIDWDNVFMSKPVVEPTTAAAFSENEMEDIKTAADKWVDSYLKNYSDRKDASRGDLGPKLLDQVQKLVVEARSKTPESDKGRQVVAMMPPQSKTPQVQVATTVENPQRNHRDEEAGRDPRRPPSRGRRKYFDAKEFSNQQPEQETPTAKARASIQPTRRFKPLNDIPEEEVLSFTSETAPQQVPNSPVLDTKAIQERLLKSIGKTPLRPILKKSTIADIRERQLQRLDDIQQPARTLEERFSRYFGNRTGSKDTLDDQYQPKPIVRKAKDSSHAVAVLQEKNSTTVKGSPGDVGSSPSDEAADYRKLIGGHSYMTDAQKSLSHISAGVTTPMFKRIGSTNCLELVGAQEESTNGTNASGESEIIRNPISGNPMTKEAILRMRTDASAPMTPKTPGRKSNISLKKLTSSGHKPPCHGLFRTPKAARNMLDSGLLSKEVVGAKRSGLDLERTKQVEGYLEKRLAQQSAYPLTPDPQPLHSDGQWIPTSAQPQPQRKREMEEAITSSLESEKPEKPNTRAGAAGKRKRLYSMTELAKRIKLDGIPMQDPEEQQKLYEKKKRAEREEKKWYEQQAKKGKASKKGDEMLKMLGEVTAADFDGHDDSMSGI